MADVLCRWLLWPLLLVPLLLTHTTAGPRYSSRIVDTQYGAVRGIILEPHSRHLEPVEAFLGVPYATAARLHPPRPYAPWYGTRLADTFGPCCPQKFPDISNISVALTNMPKARYEQVKKMAPFLSNQSEDCFNLNIYIPGSGNRGMEAPYAILVWIHGDSYEWGSGNPYDGSVLASHGHVIVITLNFRLGLLGFLKSRPNNVPGSTGGNLALRDLCAALRWIKHNLQNFGGDTSRVILLGHAQGAALANFLLLTTEAKGLFQRLILFSGSALSPWALVRNADSLRSAVSEQLGCSSDKIKEGDDLEPCLRTKSLESILDVRIEGEKFMSRWGPSSPIEPGALDVYNIMESSEVFVKCGLFLAVTSTESFYDFSATDVQYGFEEEYRNRVLRTYVRNAYVYHLNEIYAAIRNEYTDWEKPIQHPINIRDSTMEALSDGHTAAPILRIAALHARRGASTYLMHFAYQTKEGDYPQRLGSVRGEPVAYSLGLPLVAGIPYFPANYSRQDAAVSEALMSLIVSFAKTGDPNPKTDFSSPQYVDYGREKTKFKDISWTQFDMSTQQYLWLGAKPKIKTHYRGHKMALWLNLIPQLHQPGATDVSMRHHHFKERDPNYYTGPVRPESYTLMFARAELGLGEERSDVAECEPSVEELGELDDELEVDDETPFPPEQERDLLQKLANKHFYSYTAALGVTVGIGCFLLLLNMLIFFVIYYQRGRGKRRKTAKRTNSATSISDGLEKGRQTEEDEIHEMNCVQQPPTSYRSKGSVKNQMPCSALDEGIGVASGSLLRSTKKRVQIQEISV